MLSHPKPIVYEQVQGSLGQSNLISISLPWVKVSQGNLVRLPSPSTISLPQSLVFISPLFDQTMTPIPRPTTLTTYFHAIQLPSKAKGGEGGGLGDRRGRALVKKKTYLKTTTHKKKKSLNVIPQRRPAWVTPVRGMINDSIFCLCCLLPLAAAAIYHHPLSAAQSSSDSGVSKHLAHAAALRREIIIVRIIMV